MRVVVAGGRGMLGHALVDAFAGHDVVVPERSAFDITVPASVAAAVAGADLVVNAAAYTRVDDAESDELSAHAVNADGAENLARAAALTGARFVQVSTDYVFDGNATTPYSESAVLAPLGAYGRTKAAGEVAVRSAHPSPYIVRTAWLYGEHGGNFVTTMLNLASQRDTLDVVDDQVGQPTWTSDLARQIAALIDADAPAGIYHGTSSGHTSWFAFARAIFDEAGLDPSRVRPTTSDAFVRPAPRPRYSVLGHDAWIAAGLSPIRPWRNALREALPLILRAR